MGQSWWLILMFDCNWESSWSIRTVKKSWKLFCSCKLASTHAQWTGIYSGYAAIRWLFFYHKKGAVIEKVIGSTEWNLLAPVWSEVAQHLPFSSTWLEHHHGMCCSAALGMFCINRRCFSASGWWLYHLTNSYYLLISIKCYRSRLTIGTTHRWWSLALNHWHWKFQTQIYLVFVLAQFCVLAQELGQ